jgi:hypothetical protein
LGSDGDWLAGDGGRPETSGVRQEAAAELAGDGRESVPVLEIARKRLQEEEGKMWKLTRGSEGREEHQWRRSRRRSDGRAVLQRRRCCGEGGEKEKGAGWRGGAAAPL